MSQQWRKLPKDFLKRLPTLVPKENIKTILDAYTKKRPTTIRVNTLKTSVAMLLSYFDKQQILYTKSDISPLSFIIHNQLTDIQKLDAYTNGLFYVQSLSSQLPALILNPQPGDSVLDIAAAPGSKTSQIAAMMDNTGEIVANDNSRIRGYKLQKNLDTLGVMNTKVTVSPGQTLWKQYENYFDKVLVDAPCSGEGIFTTVNPKTYEHWSIDLIHDCVERQKWLLQSAISSTKAGGIIVYSTCTLEHEENEAIIDWILKREKNNLVLISEPIHIYPTEYMEGFYIAKLQKRIVNNSSIG